MEVESCWDLDHVVWEFDESFVGFLEYEVGVGLCHSFLDVCELAEAHAHFDVEVSEDDMLARGHTHAASTLQRERPEGRRNSFSSRFTMSTHLIGSQHSSWTTVLA